MTTRSTLRPQIADYAHLEPLPDPEREPDMQQHEGMISFQTIHRLHFAHRDGGLLWGHSAALGLDLCWDDGELRFRDPTTGEFLPTPEEPQAERDAAEARADAAEAEAEMLRERLRRLRQD